jgi:peptidoglycan/xylan/chitin deacetylase (PgdA/CDA1 family)
MYLIKIPKIIKIFKKDLIWDMPGEEKNIYLTFDDGPEKDVTPQILDILDCYEAKATFFCTGSKADKHPEIIDKIKKNGHSIGNHSYSHLKGTKTSTLLYLADIAECAEILKTNLLRPPYGKITRQQKNSIKKQYKIIMWSVLPGDFDRRVPKEMILYRASKYTKRGTIIVFHDNIQAKEKVIYTLPRYIEHFGNLGYKFAPITEELFG